MSDTKQKQNGQRKEEDDELDTYFSSQKIKIPETDTVGYPNNTRSLKATKLFFRTSLDLVFVNYGLSPDQVFWCP